MQPWSILQSQDEEKQKKAISTAITTIYEGNVPEEYRGTFTDVMTGILNVILFPMTTTQLGIFANFLDMRKLDVLGTVDARAREFKDRFLDIFVQDNAREVIALNEATPHFDELWKQPIMDQDAWAEEWEKFTNRPRMIKKQRALRNLFRDELHGNTEPLTQLSPNVVDRLLRKNPRLVAGIGHTFNFLGGVGASISVFREILNPNSGFRQGDPRAVFSVVATAIGGVGSIKGTYDLAKVLGERVLRWYRSPGKVKFYGLRQSEELAEVFEEGVATEFAVDLNNMERASNRLARMSKAAKLGRVFTALGVVADTIFFGISVYDLYKDFTADSIDPWKVADDFALAASAGVGAALGG